MLGFPPVLSASLIAAFLLLGNAILRPHPATAPSGVFLAGAFHLAVTCFLALPRSVRLGAAPRLGLGGPRTKRFMAAAAVAGAGFFCLTAGAGWLLLSREGLAAVLLLFPVAAGEAAVCFGVFFEALRRQLRGDVGKWVALFASIILLAGCQVILGFMGSGWPALAMAVGACALSGVFYLAGGSLWAAALFLDVAWASHFAPYLAPDFRLLSGAVTLAAGSAGLIWLTIFVLLRGEVRRAQER